LLWSCWVLTSQSRNVCEWEIIQHKPIN
jgi:hypothetical protein